LNQKHAKMLIVCMSLFIKGSKCPPFARTHLPGDAFLHREIAVAIISPGMCPCKWL